MRTAIRPVGCCILVAACASGTPSGGGDDIEDPIDARSVDAPAPTAIDAAVPTDAPTCMAGTRQLIGNAALDATPMGMGWMQMPFDPQYPLVTDQVQQGIPAHTQPFKAWLGGFVDGVDSMYQDVAVPAGTTALVLRYQYEVRSGEILTGVFDRAFVELTNASGTVLETVQSVTNDARTTAWTAFQRPFTGTYAGQTVRLRFRSTNDFSRATSFFFDSLALDATVSCP